MSAEVERKLRELSPRMQKLDELKAERDRQRVELSAAEELLKQLKWASYQAEHAYVQAEEMGAGLGGFFSRVFSDHKAKNEELLQVAQDARDTYEAAKDKLKPLREELGNLEREVAELEAARPEYEAALEARLRAAAGPANQQLLRLQEQVRVLAGLLGRCEQLGRQAQKLESMLLRCDRSNLFTIRAEFTPMQKELGVFILEASALPAEWSLPALPNEADVRMLDPVGCSSKIHFPDSTQDRMIELAAGVHGLNIHREAARMRAIVNAGHASDEAIRQEARYQSTLCGDWAKKVCAFADGLRRVKIKLQQQIEAIILPSAVSAPATELGPEP